MNDEILYKSYYSIKYFNDNNVYTRIYHGKEDDYRIKSAQRNERIEFISEVYYADSRSSADRIAKHLFGIIEEEENE